MGYVAQRVRHVELVRRERLFADMYEVWDVHTNKGRWWVVTPFMNLYPQRSQKSVDEVLSFHVGLSFRVGERDSGGGGSDRPPAESWRHLRQAADALKAAEETVQFQAIGVALREALLALVREEAKPEVVPTGQEAPQLANFLSWSKLVAAYHVPGSSRQELRAHLHETARTAWVAVGWLIHAQNAGYWDAELIYKATEYVLSEFHLARIRHQRPPRQCPVCGSARRTVEFANGNDETDGFMETCLRCGWEGERRASRAGFVP